MIKCKQCGLKLGIDAPRQRPKLRGWQAEFDDDGNIISEQCEYCTMDDILCCGVNCLEYFNWVWSALGLKIAAEYERQRILKKSETCKEHLQWA